MAFEPLQFRIFGLGGAGINVLDRLAHDGASHEDLVAVNTDLQSLTASVAGCKIQLGKRVTRGLGAGGDPELGYAAAEEAIDEIRSALGDAGVVFVCTGLGGGTGSGAAPLIVQTAREAGAFVVVFATMPFQFEGRRRMQQAEEALTAIQQRAHAVVCFENDRMGEALSPQAGIHEAFSNADRTVSESMLAMSAMVNRESLIQLGFDEVLSVLKQPNARCLFGFGTSDSDNRATESLERALANPLMDRGRLLKEAEHLIVQVTGGPTMTLYEVQMLMEEISKLAGDKTHVMFGLGVDKDLGEQFTVMLFSSVTPWRTGSGDVEVEQVPARASHTTNRPSIARPTINPPSAQPSPARAIIDERKHAPEPDDHREASAADDDLPTPPPERRSAFVPHITPAASMGSDSPDSASAKGADSQPMSTLARITQRVQASMGMIRPPHQHSTASGSASPSTGASPGIASARFPASQSRDSQSDPRGSQRDYRDDPRDEPPPQRTREFRPRQSVQENAPDPSERHISSSPSAFQVGDREDKPTERVAQRQAAAPLAPETKSTTSREPARGDSPRAPFIKQRKPSDEDPGLPVHSTRIVPVRPQARIVGPQQNPVEAPKQEMLQFDPVNRGRFEKSEPTIVDGEDLDVPTFMRQNTKATGQA